MIHPVPKPRPKGAKPRKRMKRGRTRLRARGESPTVRAFLAAVAGMPCWLCGKHPADPDHWVRRSSRGKKHPEKHWNNVWPLCRRHHNEKHRIGRERFVARYQCDPAGVCRAVTAMWQEGRKYAKQLAFHETGGM